jgi:hypothetical protein
MSLSVLALVPGCNLSQMATRVDHPRTTLTRETVTKAATGLANPIGRTKQFKRASFPNWRSGEAILSLAYAEWPVGVLDWRVEGFDLCYIAPSRARLRSQGVEIALSTAAVEVADDSIASFRPGVGFRTNRQFLKFGYWIKYAE